MRTKAAQAVKNDETEGPSEGEMSTGGPGGREPPRRFERHDRPAIHESVLCRLPVAGGNMTPGAKQAGDGVFHTSHSTMSARLPDTTFGSMTAASAQLLPHMLPLHTEAFGTAACNRHEAAAW